MGRNNTGAVTTNEVQKIELSFLLKYGYLKKDKASNNVVTWGGGGSIRIRCTYTNDERNIRLIYKITDSCTDEVTNFDYTIQLCEIPSNLGNGNVLYFICPETGKNCRILYKCYDSYTWKSREAYKKRIYYTSQIGSKQWQPNDMFWRYENKILPELKSRIKNSHYRGKSTKAQKNYENALKKRDYYDEKRFGILAHSLGFGS